MRPTISFEEDAKLVQQLIDLLGREQASLVANKIDEIETLIDLKARLLQQINHIAKNRYAALAEKGFQPNENGMIDWVHDQSNQVIKDNWKTFQDMLVKAKELNRLNGVLIARHFNRNQQVLNQLQGASQKNAVYGKDGQTATRRNLRATLTA